MPFDQKCLDLAEYFLPSPKFSDSQQKNLAEHIQASIEDWMLASEVGL